MNYPNITFPRKGYGRIFVEKEEDIEKVKQIIKNMDEFEYSYMPDNLICVLDEQTRYKYIPKKDAIEQDVIDGVRTVYTHKFDSLDLNLLSLYCFEAGIKMFYWYGTGFNYEHN